MVRVKICGIKNIDDARDVAEAGADQIGFHVGLQGGRSPLTSEEAAGIIHALPPGVVPVVVTSISDPHELVELARATSASILQLYGDTTPAQISEAKAALPGIAVWKVISVESGDALGRAQKYEASADAIVLDTHNKETGLSGGSGATHDWSISRRIKASLSVPVILAGGLNPENVADVAAVGPAGVDVNSGVSNADGTKNIPKVKLFIERAKAARP